MIKNKTSTKAVRCPSCGAAYVTVPGEPASKANSRKIVTIKGKVASIKSDKARALAATWEILCPKLPVLLDGDLVAHMWLYYASRRPDLDESVILDLLQNRVYSNDRQVREKHVYHRLDPASPRSAVLVAPMEGCTGCTDGGCLLRELDHN